MQLGLDDLTGTFWQELVLGGPGMGECCTDGPAMGLPCCVDGLEIGTLSMCMGQMCCLLWQYVLPRASIM